MLKKISLKKITLTSFTLFTLLLIYLMPQNNLYTLDNIKQTIEYVKEETLTHDIYLLDKNNYLALTTININNKKTESLAKELLSYLIIGNDKIPNGFHGTLNSETNINSLSIEDNIIKVNFSKDILDINKNLEEKMIESIVYTLTSINSIKGVIIYVDNNVLTNLPKTNKKIPSMLDRNYGINKEYDINKLSNIEKTTIYFVSAYNDNTYYVPVTKYLNDDREKISIVIDELTNISYNSNLMSYANKDLNLVSMNIDKDTMNLEFNSSLFDDIDTKEVLEEVLYTISLSALDNYDVKYVSMKVNNEEIYKSK